VTASELPVNARLCAIGQQLYATGGGRVCLFGAPSDGARSCTPQPLRASCPGNLDADPPAWLAEAGPVQLPTPPGELGGSTLVERYVLTNARGMAPAGKWISDDLRTIYNVDDHFVVLERIVADEARQLGHMREEHARVELLDAGGDRLGSAELFRPPAAWLLGPAANEVVLLAATLDQVARFERSTLTRIDQPEPETELVRLRIWGGRSAIFEVALYAVPYGAALLVLALAAFGIPRVRRSAHAWTILRRSSALFGAIALAVAVTTAEKTWYF
jgi:hypothetical protein